MQAFYFYTKIHQATNQYTVHVKYYIKKDISVYFQNDFPFHYDIFGFFSPILHDTLVDTFCHVSQSIWIVLLIFTSSTKKAIECTLVDCRRQVTVNMLINYYITLTSACNFNTCILRTKWGVRFGTPGIYRAYRPIINLLYNDLI